VHDRPDRGSDDDTLTDQFWSVARQLRHQSRDSLAPWDISPSHSRALMVLGRHGTMRLSELSDHLHIAPRSTTEVVDALEERGLVRRRPDPHDRRATLVEVTDEGLDTMNRARAARAKESEAYFGRLIQTHRTALRRILRRLQDD
jgi:DNA-binding MarR family transcriptional regulator